MAHFHVEGHERGYELVPEFFKDDLSPQEREYYQEMRQAFEEDGQIVVDGNFETGETVNINEIWERLSNIVIFERENSSTMLFHPNFAHLTDREEAMWDILEEQFPQREITGELAREFDHNEELEVTEFFHRVTEYYREVVKILLH